MADAAKHVIMTPQDHEDTDFDVELELLKNNPEFMTLMKLLSQEKSAISLQDLRKELGV
jgi:hypothetical protein